MEKVLAIVMAGGAGERLQPLTRERSKAAVPFGGKFRLIDFTLSNCINSGLRQIYVLTQYLSESLNQHIQNGWGISSSGLGDFIYGIPAQQKFGSVWYRGTADAVRQNLNLIKSKNYNEIVILSGDHLYKMDYRLFVDFHRLKRAVLTIAAIRVKKEEAAGRLGVLEIDADNRLIGFEEKPAEPKVLADAEDQTLASMGVYVFKVDTLLEILRGEEEDFGKHIIPGMIGKHDGIYIYDYEKQNLISDYHVEVKDGKRENILVPRIRDSAYWKDVGTIDSYYEASMDLLSVDPQFNLYGKLWPLRTFQRPLPPSKCILGGRALESIMSDGCIISGGTVWNSIVSPGVIVERDALVEQSVLFDDAVIEPGAKVRRAIIDKECKVSAGATVGFDRAADLRKGCTVSGNNITVVPKGLTIDR